MSEDKKVRGKRPNAGETPRPVVSCRIAPALYSLIRAEARENELALTEVMERRLQSSFDAETLEALLRRVVREEIRSAVPRILAADLCHDLLIGPFAHGLTPVPDDDAQH